MSKEFIQYQWRGEPVTEEEFLRLADSKMVKARKTRHWVNIHTGERNKEVTEVEVPRIFIETQRCMPSFGDYEWYTEIEETKPDEEPEPTNLEKEEE